MHVRLTAQTLVTTLALFEHSGSNNGAKRTVLTAEPTPTREEWGQPGRFGLFLACVMETQFVTLRGVLNAVKGFYEEFCRICGLSRNHEELLKRLYLCVKTSLLDTCRHGVDTGEAGWR